MKIFEFFRREKERKPVVLKDLTKFELYRVYVEQCDDDALLNAAELYVIAESSDDANLQIRRLLEWRGAAKWANRIVSVLNRCSLVTSTRQVLESGSQCAFSIVSAVSLHKNKQKKGPLRKRSSPLCLQSNN